MLEDRNRSGRKQIDLAFNQCAVVKKSAIIFVKLSIQEAMIDDFKKNFV